MSFRALLLINKFLKKDKMINKLQIWLCEYFVSWSLCGIIFITKTYPIFMFA